MTKPDQDSIYPLSQKAEKDMKLKTKGKLLFVAAVDTNGNVSYFRPKDVKKCKPLVGPCKATKLLESDAISYAIFEGNSRHSIIKSGGTKIHIKTK